MNNSNIALLIKSFADQIAALDDIINTLSHGHNSLNHATGITSGSIIFNLWPEFDFDRRSQEIVELMQKWRGRYVAELKRLASELPTGKGGAL